MESIPVEGLSLKPLVQVTKRFPGLDLMKLSFVIAIVIFHVWENFVYQDVMWLPKEQSFYSYYAVVLPMFFHFAGPFLAGVSFFLFGYHHSRFSLKKLIVFVLGVLLIQYSAPGPENFWQTSSWSWDVYSYLIVTYLITALIPNSTWPEAGLVVVGLLALVPSSAFYSDLLLPFFSERIAPQWPHVVSALVQNPGSNPPNGWFLIPWVFLPLALHGLGFLARQYESSLKKLRLWEVGVFLLVATLLIGQTEHVPFFAGPRFYEFQFWQKSSHFWMNFVIFLFYVRLQFAIRLQPLFHSWFFRQASKLQWVKNLWLCYFLHFMILQILLFRSTEIRDTPFALDGVCVIIFVGTEISAQLIFWLQKQAQRRRTSVVAQSDRS